MKIVLLVVGKTTDPHFAAGIDDYANRIRHYLPFDVEVIPELRNTKSLSEEQQKEKRSRPAVKGIPTGRPHRPAGRTRTGIPLVGVRRMDGKEDGGGTEAARVRGGRPVWVLAARLRERQ